MGRRRPSVFLGVFLREVDRNTFFFFRCAYRLALHRNALRIARPPGINARSARQAPPRDAVVAAAPTSTSNRRRGSNLTRSAARHKYKAADSPGTRPRRRGSSPQKRGRAASPTRARGTAPSHYQACAYNTRATPWTPQRPRRRRGRRSAVGQLPTRPSRSGLARSRHT